MNKTEIIQILAGFIGTLGFAAWFNIRGKRLFFAAFGGFLSWALFVVSSKIISNEVLIYLIVSVLVSLYSEIMARVLKTPATSFLTTSLVPLIPGASLYYTIASAFESNPDMFIQKAIYTLQLASALALGIIIAATLTKIFFKIKVRG